MPSCYKNTKVLDRLYLDLKKLYFFIRPIFLKVSIQTKSINIEVKSQESIA